MAMKIICYVSLSYKNVHQTESKDETWHDKSIEYLQFKLWTANKSLKYMRKMNLLNIWFPCRLKLHKKCAIYGTHITNCTITVLQHIHSVTKITKSSEAVNAKPYTSTAPL